MNANHDKKQAVSKVSVIGLGYIGLPTAAVLAARKIQVLGVDIREQVVDSINRGEVHFIEPELDIMVHSVVSEGYLRATLKPESADVFIIAVPTPFKQDHQPNLDYIEVASKSIAPVLKKGNLVILESTSPVGTTEQMEKWLATNRSDLTFPGTEGEHSDIRIAYCPERVMPGHILHELIHNDRIIGGVTPHCSAKALQLYKLFVEGECIVTDNRTAEMCKLTENSFRDVNIAFANELSVICDKLEINVWELLRLANRHPRVNILKPGPGVGGHCIAVDPWFIVSQAPKEAILIKTAREVNDNKALWVIEKVKLAVDKCLQNSPEKTNKDITIVCLGLTYKANIDDLRESPALEITHKITSVHLGHVLIVEPNIKTLPSDFKNNAALCNLEEALAEADIVVKLVGHNQFATISQQSYPGTTMLDVCGESIAL